MKVWLFLRKTITKKNDFMPDCAFATMMFFDFSIDTETYFLYLRHLVFPFLRILKGATDISLQ